MGERRWYHWEGAVNARDLGGLPLVAGGETRTGGVIRAGTTARITRRGWEQAVDDGVRTVVDLRHTHERARDDLSLRPDAIATVATDLEDDQRDRGFWEPWLAGGLDGTPLFFGPFLEHAPERVAATLAAVARADPDGAVLVHCSAGRDRTGLVSLLLLALAGVTETAVVEDYLLTDGALAPAWRELGREDEAPLITARLEEEGTTRERVLRDVLHGLDVRGLMTGSGLAGSDVAALEARLAGPPGPVGGGEQGVRA